jgi:multimeric flavodoxin WrbA
MEFSIVSPKLARVVAILGSPRRGGNSDALAAEFLRGASSGATGGQGTAHKTIIPSDLGLAACDGDNRCFAEGKCVIRDGMNEIYDEVLSATHLLIATPVYFMGPPGSLKCFIDRFQAVWARAAVLKTFDPDARDRRAAHRAFAIYACAAKDAPNIWRPAVSIVKAFCNVTGFDYAGEIIATGLEAPDDVTRRDDLVKQAFAAGQAFTAG